METIANETLNPNQDTANDWLAAHGDYLFNLAVGQVRDPVVAEDLVQDTFLAALKARDRFAGRSSDRTWLVDILRHKIFDHLRRVCRQRPVHVDNAVRPDQEAWDDTVLWAHEAAGECLEPNIHERGGSQRGEENKKFAVPDVPRPCRPDRHA